MPVPVPVPGCATPAGVIALVAAFVLGLAPSPPAAPPEAEPAPAPAAKSPVAVELEIVTLPGDPIGVKQVVPMHWGTFPILTGTPDALRASLARTGVEILELKPGETAE